MGGIENDRIVNDDGVLVIIFYVVLIQGLGHLLSCH